jgi:negative regulator of flagellin synthesis FlgM
MRIDAELNAGSVTAGQYDKIAGRRSADSTRDAIGTDEVYLSSDQSTVKTLEMQASQVADVRADKVEALRKQIADGTYRVDIEGVADALLRDPLITGRRW